METITKPLSKAAQKRQDKINAVLRLREILTPGTTVYTSLCHVSRSGMFRRIKLFVNVGGEIRNISGDVSTVLGEKWCDDGSVGVSGCGMDMGFHLVHSLSYSMHPEGFPCCGKGCPSNEHSNGDRNYGPHHHKTSGYSLQHRWM